MKWNFVKLYITNVLINSVLYNFLSISFASFCAPLVTAF